MKLYTVKSCWDCPHNHCEWLGGERCDKTGKDVSQHVEDGTIHPDCPLPDAPIPNPESPCKRQ